MSTFDDMPDGPGAFFWGVIITLVILILSMSLCGCEEETTPNIMRGKWEGSNVNIELSLDLFQAGTVVTGSGQLTLNFATSSSYNIDVTGHCFYPSISLVLSGEGMENIFYNAMFDNSFTAQGKFYNNQALTLIKL